MKGKLQLAIAALLVLILSGGFFAYTFTTAGGTIGVSEPTGNIMTAVNATATQPDWDSILTDLSSENKTCGEVPSGDLFSITPHSEYEGGAMATVCLVNTANLTKAYQYLNMKLYIYGSEEAEETPNYRLLTLQNGEVSFTRVSIVPTLGTWTQTSQADFEGGALNQVDATTSPGDVIFDTFSDTVTDSYNDQTKIASSVNVTVSGGQAKLSYSPGTPATETSRPNAVGDETGLTPYPGTGEANWQDVDDVTSDGDTTYVESQSSTYLEDLYNLPNHVSGSGVINYVRVYFVAKHLRGTDPANQASAYAHIKTNGVERNGTAVTLTGSYASYSYQWNNNPQTGSPWTWTEIDNLQAGVGMQYAFTRGATKTRYSRCTQVYVEVSYTPVTYYASGRIKSVNLLSSEKVVSIDSFDYNASAIPSGTGLKVQFSTDNTSWYNSAGTAGGWDTLSQGTHNINLSGLGWSGPNFYYHMLFTSDGSDTPLLDEISVNFSTYYATGDLTSSAYDSTYDVDWGTISFTISEPSTTDIKFQIRSAATEAGLGAATWYGPTGTGDYYQVSGTAINSVHDGDRWIQYKAYFSGPGDSTSTFSDITISYSGTPITFVMEVVGGGYCLVSDNTSEWGSGWAVTPELYCEVTQR